MSNYRSYLFQSFFLAALFIFSTCARNPVTGKQELMFISEDQEIAMGQESKQGAIAQYGIYDNDPIQRYIEDKGKAMAAISHRPNLNWEFKVMDSPVVNAFAAPGGFVFFTRGIMVHFNNEAQFMGVLGHEIGHVTARHSASQLSKQMATQVGLVAGMVISPELAQMGDLLGQGAQMMFSSFSRDDESQSDKLGVEYSTKVGYNAEEMASFFNTLKRLQDQAGGAIPSFYSTHPDPADRDAAVDKLADQWRSKLNVDLASLKVNRESYLERIDGMVYGNDPTQGFFEGDRFYHPTLKFQFPAPRGWIKQNTPAQVVMVTEDQKAGILLKLGEGSSPKAAAEQAVQGYGLSVVESGESSANGMQAYYVVGDISEQNSNQAMRLMVFNIAYNGLIYQFLGFADRSAFSRYEDIFSRTMRNFDKLSDLSKLNRKPERIQVVELDRNMTLTDALNANGIPGSRHEEFAILNGLEIHQSLPAGSFIKIAK